MYGISKICSDIASERLSGEAASLKGNEERKDKDVGHSGKGSYRTTCVAYVYILDARYILDAPAYQNSGK